MMRIVSTAILCLLVPVTAAAQQTSERTPASSSIGLPLPPVGLPLPPIGLDAPGSRQTTPPPQTPGNPDRHHRARIVIFGAPYAFGMDPALYSSRPGEITTALEPPASPEASSENSETKSETGILLLKVEPSKLAQVFVDGVFVGTPDDLEGELELDAGRRQIEIRARGYEPLLFDIRVVAGRTLTYDGRLERLEPAAAPKPGTPDAKPAEPAFPAKTKPVDDTFYMIPGCYLGSVPPEKVKLPARCDLSKVIIHKTGRR